MLKVDVDKIIPLTEARDSLNKIVDDVEKNDQSVYVLTRNGTPIAMITGVNHLEKLTGGNSDALTASASKTADGKKEDGEKKVDEPLKTEETKTTGEPKIETKPISDPASDSKPTTVDASKDASATTGADDLFSDFDDDLPAAPATSDKPKSIFNDDVVPDAPPAAATTAVDPQPPQPTVDQPSNTTPEPPVAPAPTSGDLPGSAPATATTPAITYDDFISQPTTDDQTPVPDQPIATSSTDQLQTPQPSVDANEPVVVDTPPIAPVNNQPPPAPPAHPNYTYDQNNQTPPSGNQ